MSPAPRRLPARTWWRSGLRAGARTRKVRRRARAFRHVPGRLDVLKWPLVAGFIGVFAAGSNSSGAQARLSSRPCPRQDSADYSRPSAPRSSAQNANSFAVNPPPPPRLENVNAAVATSLDYLKEQLFRLEFATRPAPSPMTIRIGAGPRGKSSSRPRSRVSFDCAEFTAHLPFLPDAIAIEVCR